jgi:hypothetical protein
MFIDRTSPSRITQSPSRIFVDSYVVNTHICQDVCAIRYSFVSRDFILIGEELKNEAESHYKKEVAKKHIIGHI